jgi:hypothetical protein
MTISFDWKKKTSRDHAATGIVHGLGSLSANATRADDVMSFHSLPKRFLPAPANSQGFGLGFSFPSGLLAEPPLKRGKLANAAFDVFAALFLVAFLLLFGLGVLAALGILVLATVGIL